jgi:hypothetical protein
MDDPHVRRGDLYALVVEGFHALDTGTPSAAHTVDDFRPELPQTVISGARYSQFLQATADAEYTARHCVSNFRVSNFRVSNFRVSNFRLVSHHPTSATVAYVVDEWIRVDHHWRHRSRSISPTFSIGA